MVLHYLLLIVLYSSYPLFAGYENHLKKALNKTPISNMKGIDYIYMINLDERPEKFEKSISQLHPYGIYPYRFSAVNGWKLPLEVINDVGVKYEPGMTPFMASTYTKDAFGFITELHEVMSVPGRSYFVHCLSRGAIGIYLSHLSVLKDAYDSKYERIWIMEDDIEVLGNPRIISDLIKKLNKLVGKKGWDILFTDKDFRNPWGQYVASVEVAQRPNFNPSHVEKLKKRKNISEDFSRVGGRYGAASMIVNRKGMKKILKFVSKYSIFIPYDLDFGLPPKIKLYSLNYDLVSQLAQAISDNGTPPPPIR